MRYLNPAEIACLAEAIRPGYQALVFVGASGGLRIAGWPRPRRRVDLDAGTVDVAETVVEVEGWLLFGPPKTAPPPPDRARAGWSRSWRCTCEHRAARPIRCSAHRPAGHLE